MVPEYDKSRRNLLVSEEAELVERLSSVRHNIVLEDSKANAYKSIKRIADKFPYIVIRKRDILTPSARTEQYVLKSEYVACNPPTDSSTIEIRGVAMVVFQYHDLPPITYVTVYENHDKCVELWCGEVNGLIAEGSLAGLTREETQKFIAYCMQKAGDGDPEKIKEVESEVL